MSTNANIAIINNDKSIDAIYVHWDGYPSHHVPILTKHYNTEEKLRELINLGDLSSLAPKIGPAETEDDDDAVVAYHRDLNEKWDDVKPMHMTNIDEFKEKIGVDYAYAFDCETGKWLISDGGDFREL